MFRNAEHVGHLGGGAAGAHQVGNANLHGRQVVDPGSEATDERRDIQTDLAPLYGYEEILAAAEDTYKWPVLDERSAYGACYTTGTTGRPNGVYYSHRNIYLHVLAIASNTEISYRDCFYQLVPMFHALGWGMPHASIIVGAKFVLPGMYNIADLGSLAEPLVAKKVTVTAGAPALFMPMLEHIRKLEEKPDLRGARFISGATEPSLALMRGFHEMTGTIDAEGYVKITDRVKDLIKSGGEWISSVDMENEIMAHPKVLEAAVTGVAHPKWQERPIALVVPRPEHRDAITAEEIRTHLSAKFAKWQLPEAVVFVEAIPKTSVGKFNKKEIRESYKDIYTEEG